MYQNIYNPLDKDNTISRLVDLDKNLYKQLKMSCAVHDFKMKHIMSAILDNGIKEFLAQHKPTL